MTVYAWMIHKNICNIPRLSERENLICLDKLNVKHKVYFYFFCSWPTSQLLFFLHQISTRKKKTWQIQEFFCFLQWLFSSFSSKQNRIQETERFVFLFFKNSCWLPVGGKNVTRKVSWRMLAGIIKGFSVIMDREVKGKDLEKISFFFLIFFLRQKKKKKKEKNY